MDDIVTHLQTWCDNGASRTINVRDISAEAERDQLGTHSGQSEENLGRVYLKEAGRRHKLALCLGSQRFSHSYQHYEHWRDHWPHLVDSVSWNQGNSRERHRQEEVPSHASN